MKKTKASLSTVLPSRRLCRHGAGRSFDLALLVIEAVLTRQSGETSSYRDRPDTHDIGLPAMAV